MAKVDVERVGGLAGFGSPGSHLRSRGCIDASQLATKDQGTLEALFARGGGQGTHMPDGFRYRLTRLVGGRTETVEVPEHELPAPVRDCVQDELE